MRLLGIRKRKTDFGGTAQVEDAIRILRTFALLVKNGVDAFRFPFQEFHGLDAGEDGLFFFGIGTKTRDASCSTDFGAERNALRGEVFFSVIMRSKRLSRLRRIAKLGLVE